MGRRRRLQQSGGDASKKTRALVALYPAITADNLAAAANMPAPPYPNPAGDVIQMEPALTNVIEYDYYGIKKEDPTKLGAAMPLLPEQPHYEPPMMPAGAAL